MPKALLDRGADPALLMACGYSVLTSNVGMGRVHQVAHLLQHPRVRATVNLKSPSSNMTSSGKTALHMACNHDNETRATALVRLLLQAGANPSLTADGRLTPVDVLPNNHPTHHTTIAFLEQVPDAAIDAERASLLVKARCLGIAAISTTAATSSYLQGRVARGQPLPRLELVAVGRKKRANRRRKFSAMLAFLLRMAGGPKNEGMPRDVFCVVMDFVMPSWDPLRRGSDICLQLPG